MHSGFFNLFLGLLFQFNIVFRGVDVLPDVIGYYFMYKGLKILLTENAYFQKAHKLVLPLMILSIVNIYNFQFHQEILLSISYGIDIIKTLVFALNLFFVFNVYKGTTEVIAAKDLFLARNLGQRLYLYLGVSSVFLVLSVISLFPSIAEGTPLQSIFLVTYITYLFALLIIVGGMYKVYRESNQPAKQQQSKRKR